MVTALFDISLFLFRRRCASSRDPSSLFGNDELTYGPIPSHFRVVSSVDYMYIHK